VPDGERSVRLPLRDLWSRRRRTPDGLKDRERTPEIIHEYRKQALKLILDEANSVASALRLPEKLPITEHDIVASYITPAKLNARLKAVGNISTINYTYYVSVGNKFSFLEKHYSGHDFDKLKKEVLWPISRMDTNAAILQASSFLRSASMDVDRLNRESEIHVMAFTPGGLKAKFFVPVYWVYLVKRGEEELGSVASVQFLQSDMTLREMRVNRSEYILREPLNIRLPNQ
jgi:hypothetical protein